MKFKWLSRWELKPELDGLLFFAQRLDELLWDYTLDTHKPMSLNAPFLCLEAISVIRNIEHELIDAANLRPILEELTWSIKSDNTAKQLLDVPVEHYVLMEPEARLVDQKGRLDALSRTLEPHRYLHCCFDNIAAQVRAIEKKKLDFSARTLVTTLINMGVSKRSLAERTNAFFFAVDGEKISDPIDVDKFLKSIYPYHHHASAYFAVSDLIRTVKDSLRAFKINLIEELPDDIKNVAEANGFELKSGECFVEIGPLHSLDPHSAHEHALRRLDSLSDLFTLFFHQKKIIPQPIAIVRQCCTDKPVVTTFANASMNKPFDLPPEKASKELNRLLRSFSLKASRSSFDRFNRVADLHGACVATDVADNQLVTLWTSIETLVPSRRQSSKITNVLDSMIPFLMVSYVRRIVQRFTHDLVTWRRWKVRKLLNKVPDVEQVGLIPRTLAMLAVTSNAPIRDELYAELKDFHLLRYRAFQLSELLSSPKKLRSALEAHRHRVEWQIRRIYRTRNLLVHSGVRPSYIHGLIENAHDYLDQVLFDIMKLSCGEYRVSSLEQAFEIGKMRFKRFDDELRKANEFNSLNCQFLIWDIESLTEASESKWSIRNRDQGTINNVIPLKGRVENGDAPEAPPRT